MPGNRVEYYGVVFRYSVKERASVTSPPTPSIPMTVGYSPIDDGADGRWPLSSVLLLLLNGQTNRYNFLRDFLDFAGVSKKSRLVWVVDWCGPHTILEFDS